MLNIKTTKIRKGVYQIDREDGKVWVIKQGIGHWWVHGSRGVIGTWATLGLAKFDIRLASSLGVFSII